MRTEISVPFVICIPQSLDQCRADSRYLVNIYWLCIYRDKKITFLQRTVRILKTWNNTVVFKLLVSIFLYSQKCYSETQTAFFYVGYISWFTEFEIKNEKIKKYIYFMENSNRSITYWINNSSMKNKYSFKNLVRSLALLYIFVNLFTVSLNRRQLDYHTCPCI